MYARQTQMMNLINAKISATAAGTEIDLAKQFVSPGKREMKATLGAILATSDSGGTLAVKLQHSNTTVDSDFSDISGAAFTTLTDDGTAKTPQQIHFFTNKRYLRNYSTISDATTWAISCLVFAVKQDA